MPSRQPQSGTRSGLSTALAVAVPSALGAVVLSVAALLYGSDQVGMPVLVIGVLVAAAATVLGVTRGKKLWTADVEGPVEEVKELIAEQKSVLVGLGEVMTRAASGDHAIRADLPNDVDLLEFTTNMNAMLDGVAVVLQTEVDRESLQKQITELLDVVVSAADGDLTREAEVTADVMGALSDAFNMMSGELGKLIREVQGAATQVGMSTSEIVGSTEKMAHDAEEQVLQITNTATAIESMAVAISQVAENADAAVEAGRRTTDAALKGGEAVAKTMDAMYRVRNTVQQTADRIKSLGENSQEIGDIVHLIETIATQTNLLALNAAIEAARAGEAGRGFGVVAEEVRRLADRSTKAANDISTLVQSIQTEVAEAVAAMETGVSEVVDGVDLADEAGSALNEIVSVAQQSADLIQEISLSSRQQRSASESVVEQMGGISEIAKQTAFGSQQSAASGAELGQLSERLGQSVKSFRLPDRSAKSDAA
jgi:twitching motility protein PilJ